MCKFQASGFVRGWGAVGSPSPFPRVFMACRTTTKSEPRERGPRDLPVDDLDSGGCFVNKATCDFEYMQRCIHGDR